MEENADVCRLWPALYLLSWRTAVLSGARWANQSAVSRAGRCERLIETAQAVAAAARVQAAVAGGGGSSYDDGD